MRKVIAGIVPLAALMAGCGKLEVIPSGAEQTIRQAILRDRGVRITNVSCPSGVSAKVGVTFDCHFVGPHGIKYTAHMLITSVHGHRVGFDIRTFVG
jgi:hypothetical protein